MIFDIFSKKNQKENKPVIQSKIIVDIHEKNSLVPSYLQELKADIKIKSLKIGDYIISDVIIERKTISDFISSIISKRLVKQLNELQIYKKRLLILEGNIEQEISNFNPNAIKGMILSIELERNIPIIFTKDSEDTAKFLVVLAKKQKNVNFSFHNKKGLTKKQKIEYILESLSGIGPSTSKKLLRKLSTIKNIINTPINELEKIIGKKSEIFKILDEKY
jgi:Fanconi anemia group M protein